MQKTLYRRCSTGCLRVWCIELSLVPSLEIKPKKYSARKYVWHRFWKGEMSWWGLCRSSRPKNSVKWGISQNSQENICAGISFLVFSCEICKICLNNFFAEQYQTTASDYSSISRVLANKTTVNYDTNTKAYIIWARSY